jgi:hypothetical protein
LALINTEERLDDKRQMVLYILNEHEDGLICIFDALNKQVGKVFIIIEEEVECMLD